MLILLPKMKGNNPIDLYGFFPCYLYIISRQNAIKISKIMRESLSIYTNNCTLSLVNSLLFIAKLIFIL